MNRRSIRGLAIILTLGLSLSSMGWGRDNSLVLHLKFDQVTTGGTETPDASGNRNVARIHGQRVVPGVVGSALEFLGFDQIVEIGDLKLKGPATVAFWIRTNDLIRNRRLLSQLDGESDQSGALRLDGGQVEVASGQDWRPVITRGLRFDQWLHIVVVFDEKGNATGYLNGKRQETVTAKCDYNGVRVGIGAKLLGTSGNPFTGRMDDFRLYSKALTDREINNLYNLGSSQTGQTNNDRAPESKPAPVKEPAAQTDLRQSSGPVVLIPSDTNYVRLEHRDWGTAWKLQFPEFVATDRGAVLSWPAIRVQWHEQGGWVGYQWSPPADYPSQARSAGDAITDTWFDGLKVSVKMRAQPDRIDLALTLTNSGPSAIAYAISDGGCLQAQDPVFQDKTHDRTFLSVGQNPVPLSRLDRTMPVRARYTFEPSWFEERFLSRFEFFWGRSTARPDSALIATAASDGRGAIGIAFDHAFTCSQNSDEHNCIHSSPLFGPLAPGQSVTRRGVVLFAVDIPQLFRSFKKHSLTPCMDKLTDVKL